MTGCLVYVWFAILFAAFAGGVCFLYRAIKKRSGPSWFGAAVLLLPLIWYGGWCHRTDIDDWNPLPPREALHGLWTHGSSTLVFYPNGTFRIDARGEASRRVHLGRATGRWELVDYHLTLHTGDGYPRRLRVVVTNGRLRIIEAPEDFGAWPPWTGFNRVPASRAREK